jgi:hypothetical protein
MTSSVATLTARAGGEGCNVSGIRVWVVGFGV